MSTDSVIEAKGLTKRYGAVEAVSALDLSINAGEVVGLLGPNGAGKTTTILMLLGLTEPTSGSISVLGHDPFRQPLAVKRQVGYLPDAVGFYDNLSARENLLYTARLGGLRPDEAERQICSALDRVRLSDVADRRVATFSRGMRQRLGIAEVLMKRSRIAILDEPTSGLDPQSTQELLDLIAGLRREGMTIVLSSHLLGLVQSICDRVALFHRGRIGLVGRVDDLARDVLGSAYVVDVEAEDIDVAEALHGIEGIASILPKGRNVTRIDADRDIRPELARRIVSAGGALRNMAISRASLDDVYVRYFEKVAHAA